MEQVSRKQFLELYKNLPQELKEAMGSDRTVSAVERMSDQEELNSEQHSAFVTLVGEVFVGLLPPSEFKEALIEKAGIDKKSAEKINQAFHSSAFYYVQETLADLYQEKLDIKKDESKPVKRSPGGKDRYREPIEQN